MDLLAPERLRLGVSACLLGEPVRYDGATKRNSVVVDRIGPTVEWVAVCPEAEAGLGVPREPIQLEDDPSDPRIRAVHTRSDHTPRLQAWADDRLGSLGLDGLDGFVLKARSPSCEPLRAEVFDGERVVGRAPGFFAARLRAADPLLPLCDEEELEEPARRRHFLERAMARRRSRHRRGPGPWIESHRLLLVSREQELPPPDAKDPGLELLRRLDSPPTAAGHARALRWGLDHLDDIDQDSRWGLAVLSREIEIERVDPEVGRQLLRALALRAGRRALLDQRYLDPLPREWT